MSFLTNLVPNLDGIQGARMSWSQKGAGFSTSIFCAGLAKPAEVAAQVATQISGASALVARNLYGLISWDNRDVDNPDDVGQEPRRVRLLFSIKLAAAPLPYTKGIWIPAMIATDRDTIQTYGEEIAALYEADANVTSCRFLVPFSAP